MENSHLTIRSKVQKLYEESPYPPLSAFSALFQRIRWEDRPTLNYQAAYASFHGSLEGAAARPRILVAGCGTFEPVVVALANPQAEILAVDLSENSLKRLDWQARARGVRNRIESWAGDFADLPAEFGNFHFVIATGVIHHLPDPEAGLRALLARTSEDAVFRFMIYSYWGRSLLYAAKELAEGLGADTPEKMRRLMETLPANHPYKIYFHLYSDTETDTGLADGYLHPCDRAFSALGLAALLGKVGMRHGGFLHSPDGQPQAAQAMASRKSLGDWEKLALLEFTGELQENFRFFAGRMGWKEREPTTGWQWNQALPVSGRLHSRLLGKELAFDTRKSPALLPAEQIEELRRALFLIPKGLPCPSQC